MTQRLSTSTKVNKINIHKKQNIFIKNIERKRTNENHAKYLNRSAQEAVDYANIYAKYFNRSAQEAVDYVNNHTNMLSTNIDEQKKIINEYTKINKTADTPEETPAHIIAYAIRMILRRNVNQIRTQKIKSAFKTAPRKIQISINIARLLARKGIKKEILTEQKIINDALNDNDILSEFKNFHGKVKELKQNHGYSLGNCFEKAVIAVCYLLEKNPNMPIRLANLAKNTPTEVQNNQSTEELSDDHTFVLIGKGKDFQTDKPETWHKDSDIVVCDPWAKRAYKIHNFNEEMASLKLTSNIIVTWHNIE